MYIDNQDLIKQAIKKYHNNTLIQFDRNVLLDELVKFVEPFLEGTKIAHVWCDEDVMINALEQELICDKDKAREILEIIDSNCDSSIGINWNVIEQNVCENCDELEEFVEYHGRKYPIRNLKLWDKLEKCEGDYIISIESLDNAMHTKKAGQEPYFNEDAILLDESIYFYVDDLDIHLESEELRQKLDDYAVENMEIYKGD